LKFKIVLTIAASLGLSGCALFDSDYRPPPAPVAPIPADVRTLPQSSAWDDAARWAFYSLDQGSRLMPLAWFKALKTADGQPFAGDQLARWGYLRRESPSGLPVGFAIGDKDGTPYVGMSCAACHTRQIRVGSELIRIDGGPALSNLHGFFVGLDEALQRVLASDAAFNAFSAEVLPAQASAADKAALRTQFTALAGPYHEVVSKALGGTPEWGLGLADAISMIFNRLGGLDIGPPADNYLIPGNISPSNAPVRYPFLWNAAIQDKTQWAGFAPNGNRVFSLSRNLGEVYGVFADFHPAPDRGRVEQVDLLNPNSANFENLERLEQLIERIGPPQWIWASDSTWAGRGKGVYEQTCSTCHGINRKWTFGFWPLVTINWTTPVKDVCTDTLQHTVLQRTGASGLLTGARSPLQGITLGESAKLVDMLNVAVSGAILQKAAGLRQGDGGQLQTVASITSPGARQQVSQAFKAAPETAPQVVTDCSRQGPNSYEARVLQGIWAAAPYLHNGSVPTLADLLEPASRRPASFEISPDYDIDKVGLAREPQAGSLHWTYQTTDCSARDSGRSRCGHEYGTTLSTDDKKALLEYLKTL